MVPLVLTKYTTTNALGAGTSATLQALRDGRSGLRRCDFEDCDLDTFIGRVDGLEDVQLTGQFHCFDCRSNRLALLALQQDGFSEAVAATVDRYGARRIAVIIGTSTSGILEAEHAYKMQDPQTKALPNSFYAGARFTHNTFSLAEYVRQLFQIEGPSIVVSTACSASAKVFASASRFVDAEFCDAALVGGVDTLCLNTLYGFSSLGVVDTRPCRPCDVNREGLTLAEGAGFILLERPGPHVPSPAVVLEGYGESSDGYHMSHPHPAGEGAILAMRQALSRAQMTADQADYIHLHGTGTKANDSIEDRAIAEVFGCNIPCSSTKGWTGHALGAAGAIESAIDALCLEHGFLPGTLNTKVVDPAFKSNVVLCNMERPLERVVSNYFGFGGSNCTLVFSRA